MVPVEEKIMNTLMDRLLVHLLLKDYDDDRLIEYKKNEEMDLQGKPLAVMVTMKDHNWFQIQ
jgi:hypothetical protein